MARFVSLSTDANPRYSVYAPVVCRLWRKLGWEPVVALHPSYWDTELGVYIRDSLAKEQYTVYEVGTYWPLTVGNTMRVARLVGPHLEVMHDEDTVMMSDMDMIPLSRSFWALPEGWNLFSLRADIQGFLPVGAQANPVSFRFAMCYTGSRVGLWRSAFKTVRGSALDSMHNLQVYEGVQRERVLAAGGVIHPLQQDSTDVDELWMSAHLLSLDDAQGTVECVGTWEGYPLYKQGFMHMVATRQPGGLPDRMMLLGEWRLVRNDKWDLSTALDWHTSQMPEAWMGGVLSRFWPEEAEWISDYWCRAYALGGMVG